jgi:TrmH family RNA methyltransferase
VITSVHSPRVVQAARLRRRQQRRDAGAFLVEGPQVLMEAVRSGAPVRHVYHLAEADHAVQEAVSLARGAGARVDQVTDAVLDRLASTVTPQGVVAVVGFVDRPLDAVPGDAGLVPVLVEVRDPGNAGTIVRSAHAAGAGAVILSTGSVDVYNPKAVRATAGSLFHVPLVLEAPPAAAIEHLRHAGCIVLAAEADGDSSVYEIDLARPTAVLFGNESHGLSKNARELADTSVRVPIAGSAESLNLAAAAAVILFEAARQRGGALGR